MSAFLNMNEPVERLNHITATAQYIIEDHGLLKMFSIKDHKLVRLIFALNYYLYNLINWYPNKNFKFLLNMLMDYADDIIACPTSLLMD